jgi:hypothetical protein
MLSNNYIKILTRQEMKNLHAHTRPERKLASQRPISILAVLFLLAFYALLAKPGACVVDKREKKNRRTPPKIAFSLFFALFLPSLSSRKPTLYLVVLLLSSFQIM